MEIFKSYDGESPIRLQYQQADLNKPEVQSQFDDYELKWVKTKDIEDEEEEEEVPQDVKIKPKEQVLPTNNTEIIGQKKHFIRKPLS